MGGKPVRRKIAVEPIEIVGVDRSGTAMRPLWAAFSAGIKKTQFTAAELPTSDSPHAVRVAASKEAYDAMTLSAVPYEKAIGYRFEGPYGPVIPTYDLLEVGRGKMHLVPLIMRDLRNAWTAQCELADKYPPSYPYEWLLLDPAPERFEAWMLEAADSAFIVHDIETPRSKGFSEDENDEDPSYEILRVSLGTAYASAVSVPYQEPYIGMIHWLLGKEMPKVGWNSSSFDDRREKANNWPMRGKRIDAMWLWHFLYSTAPRSLGAVAPFYTNVPEWKSLGSTGPDQALYSAMDAWVTARCYRGICRELAGRTL
jgi:hypothetical protein